MPSFPLHRPFHQSSFLEIGFRGETQKLGKNFFLWILKPETQKKVYFSIFSWRDLNWKKNITFFFLKPMILKIELKKFYSRFKTRTKNKNFYFSWWDPNLKKLIFFSIFKNSKHMNFQKIPWNLPFRHYLICKFFSENSKNQKIHEKVPEFSRAFRILNTNSLSHSTLFLSFFQRAVKSTLLLTSQGRESCHPHSAPDPSARRLRNRRWQCRDRPVALEYW